MSKTENENWWTVPEAAVWIGTRDLTAVEDLGPKTRTSLAMASLEMPGVFEAANEVLLPALKAGRLAAWCKDAMGNLEEIPQDSWKDFSTFCEQWKEEEPVGITAGTLIPIVVAAGRCQSLWTTPANILPKPYPLAHVLANLDQIDQPQWILTHPAVLVTGLNDRAERVPIDQMALVYGGRNLNTNTVATTDGRLTWSEVTVELVPQEQASAQGRPEASPPEPPPVTYSSEQVPPAFESWATTQHNESIIITGAMAEDAMRGYRDDATGQRMGGVLPPGVGLSRENIRKWMKSLPEGWCAKHGEPPSRQKRD